MKKNVFKVLKKYSAICIASILLFPAAPAGVSYGVSHAAESAPEIVEQRPSGGNPESIAETSGTNKGIIVFNKTNCNIVSEKMVVGQTQTFTLGFTGTAPISPYKEYYIVSNPSVLSVGIVSYQNGTKKPPTVIMAA